MLAIAKIVLFSNICKYFGIILLDLVKIAQSLKLSNSIISCIVSGTGTNLTVLEDIILCSNLN